MRSVTMPTSRSPHRTTAAVRSWNAAVAALPHLSVMCVRDLYLVEREMSERKKMRRKERGKKKMTKMRVKKMICV
ncbi:hypothetical protein RIF29_25054 [Crotalaria pallida]|uniref:Uncharacterized protein n=1 Tax=Crotalaria pallida TaxID=3830 RepID=A0AAN9HYY7_CROPI